MEAQPPAGREPLKSPEKHHQHDKAASDSKTGGDSLPATRWVRHLRSRDQSQHPGRDDGNAAEDEDGSEDDPHASNTCRPIGGQVPRLEDP